MARIEHPGGVVEFTGLSVSEAQDALDLMASLGGARKMILHAGDLHPDFFDLSTRLAGEILQKFSTYAVQLAIVGDFSPYRSDSFRAFRRESNRGGGVSFRPGVDEALEAFR